MVSHILRRGPIYPKQVSKGRRELESGVLPLLKLLDEYQSSLPLEKLSSLTSLQFLTLKCVWGEGALAQVRQLSFKRGSYSLDRSKMLLFSPRRDNSRSGETTLAQARQLSLKRESFSIVQDFTLPNDDEEDEEKPQVVRGGTRQTKQHQQQQLRVQSLRRRKTHSCGTSSHRRH
ncbi:hypothetical protein Lal_00031426 [Lupinus albus]|nr:hypothetical protein Lal_00031426 [Lupinus albus]